MLRTLICGVMLVIFGTDSFAQGYQRPPKAVTDILDASPPQSVSVSPTGEQLLLMQGSRYPSIEEVATPQLRLAGVRIDPKTNGPARASRITSLTLVTLPSCEQKKPRFARHAHDSVSHCGRPTARLPLRTLSRTKSRCGSAKSRPASCARQCDRSGGRPERRGRRCGPMDAR